MNYDKPNAGDDFVPSASAWGAMIDSLQNDPDQLGGGGSQGSRASNPVVIRAKNDTSSMIDRGSAVEVTDVLQAPDSDDTSAATREFRFRPVFKVKLPTVSTRVWSVARRAIEPGKFGDVVIVGVAMIRVTINNATDRGVTTVAGSGKLTSRAGGFPLLWVKGGVGSATATGDQDAAIVAGAAGPSELAWIKLSTGANGVYVGAIVRESSTAWAGGGGFDDSTIGSVTSEIVTVFNLQERNDGTFNSASSLTAGTPRCHYFLGRRLAFPDTSVTPNRACYAINGVDLGTTSAES